MKTAIALFALALGASVPMQAASAADRTGATPLAAPSHDQDFSAKKKKRQRVYVYGPSYGYGYYDHYPAYRAWGAADPSWQSPELRRLRALNRCVVDLGYGRWENCD